MRVRFAWLLLGLAFAVPAGAAQQSFYFHLLPAPVAIPGGTSDHILDEITPTKAVPEVDSSALLSSGSSFQTVRYTAPAFVADTVLGALISAKIHVSSNQIMQSMGVGCADLTATVLRIDSGGGATTLALGTLNDQVVPQGGMSGTVGFAQFVFTLDQQADRLIPAGSSIAIELTITNSCTANRRVFSAYDGTTAPSSIQFTSFDPGAASCLESIDKAVGKYTKARYKLLNQCEDKIDLGILPPQDCTLEAKTADKINRSVGKAVKAILKKCTNSFVIDPPPSGIGVATCPSVTGQCGFPLAILDDGTRGNSNDYLDCMLCIVDQSVAGMVANSYASVAVPPLPVDPAACQATIGKSAITFESKRLKLLQKCRKLQNKGVITGVCPDPGTLAKVGAAQAKLAASVAGACTTAMITSDLGLVTCDGPPVSCSAPIASSNDEATCVDCTHTAFTQCLFLSTTGRTGTACP